MPKHTPGPWRVVIDDDGNPLSGRPSVHAPDDLDCAIVHWDGFVQTYWRSARGDREIHANAHLIAAAPDLLEAAQTCLDAERKRRAKLLPGAPATTYTEKRIAALEAAIAKATGEE